MPLPTNQDFTNAKRDLDDLSAIVNGGNTQSVATRTGGTKPSLAKVIHDRQAAINAGLANFTAGVHAFANKSPGRIYDYGNGHRGVLVPAIQAPSTGTLVVNVCDIWRSTHWGSQPRLRITTLDYYPHGGTRVYEYFNGTLTEVDNFGGNSSITVSGSHLQTSNGYNGAATYRNDLNLSCPAYNRAFAIIESLGMVAPRFYGSDTAGINSHTFGNGKGAALVFNTLLSTQV